MYTIGKALTLRDHLSDCANDKQASEWMIYDAESYTLDMLVYPVHLNDWDIDVEQYEALESKVLKDHQGFSNLMNPDQLIDIITNLKFQKNNYTDDELEKALDYYNEHDAFIDWSGA